MNIEFIFFTVWFILGIISVYAFIWNEGLKVGDIPVVILIIFAGGIMFFVMCCIWFSEYEHFYLIKHPRDRKKK
jgi:hypothetical protein